jgi:2-polyprenyl-6-methoxyphenol hydroxylase-like FAD-dependent oxidoreductase
VATTIKTDVVIIGAGPTGLSLGCQLDRYGVDFVIVEKNESITPYSKALGVHARTHEQIGLAQKAIDQGAIAGKGRLLVGGEVRGELDFSNIGQGMSPYPYVLLLEQSKNERLLYQYLQSRRKEVLWKTELESFLQTDSGVTARVKTADGAFKTLKLSIWSVATAQKVRPETRLDSSLEAAPLNVCFMSPTRRLIGISATTHCTFV